MRHAWRGTLAIWTETVCIAGLLASAPLALAAEPVPSERLAIVEDVVASPGKGLLSVKVLPGGRRLLWTMREKKAFRVFVDGVQVGADADGYSIPVWSEDGVHSAMLVKRGGTLTILVDGEEALMVPDPLGPARYFGVERPPLVVSTDGRTIAYWTTSPADAVKPKSEIRLLGEPFRPPVERIESVAVGAATPPRLGYAAYKDGRWTMIVDGKECRSPKTDLAELLASMKVTASFGLRGLAFGPGGKRFAYILSEPVLQEPGKDGTRLLLQTCAGVIDGKADETASTRTCPGLFSPFVFSPDGERVAWATVSGVDMKKTLILERVTVRNVGRVFVDGVAGPAYEYSGPPPSAGTLESPSGESPFFSPLIRPSWGAVSLPVFSPDSRHVAYVGRKGDRQFVLVVDGAETPLPPVDRVIGGPVYSADGRHLAVVGANEREVLAFVDGKESWKTPVSGAHLARSVVLNADGSRLAFSVTDDSGSKATHRAIVDGKAGVEIAPYPIERIFFSPDGRHVAYLYPRGRTDGNHVIVLDGLAGRGYGFVEERSLTFTPEGHVSFVALDLRGGRILRVTQSVK